MDEDNVDLKPNQVSSLKMLFFAALPETWRKGLEGENVCLCLRRGNAYTEFERGVEDYRKEIDIVNMLR